MLKELINLLCHYKFTLNPFVRYESSNIGDMSGVNELKRDVQIIITLSSSEEHFDDLELTLYSLCNQQVSPDRIILWLDDKYELSELPYTITRYIKNGLEIRFVENKKNFTQIIYTLKEFQNSIIVAVKDDIYYPADWLKKLYHSYISSPNDIHCNRAIKVELNNKQIAPYKEWKRFSQSETSSYNNYPLISGGILYPPNCFGKEIFREDIYKKKAQTTWEIWSWFIALVSNRKIRVVKNHIKTLTCTNYIRTIKQDYDYIKQSKNTDYQISKLLEFYKQNIYQKLDIQ